MDPRSLQDRLTADTAVTAPLPLSALQAGGPDAETFLQGQLTLDLRTLEPDAQRLTAWCNAKGRVWAVLRVLRSPGGFLLLLPQDQADAFERRIRMFVLRAQVEFQRLPLVAQGHILPQGSDDRRADEGAFWLPLAARQALSLQATAAPPEAEDAAARFKALRLLAGEPQIAAATQEKFLPQSLGLQELGGLHFNKGCYVGQEIVARVHYRGRAPQRLVTLIDPEDELLDGKFLLDEAFVAGRRIVQAVEYA